MLDYHAEPCKFSLVIGVASVAARFISPPGTVVMARWARVNIVLDWIDGQEGIRYSLHTAYEASPDT